MTVRQRNLSQSLPPRSLLDVTSHACFAFRFFAIFAPCSAPFPSSAPTFCLRSCQVWHERKRRTSASQSSISTSPCPPFVLFLFPAPSRGRRPPCPFPLSLMHTSPPGFSCSKLCVCSFLFEAVFFFLGRQSSGRRGDVLRDFLSRWT